uniref:Uncharacterized protein n=1 Tax=Anguilla anguilla TaxID=7936 RepID=A0A0E9TL17_ANGAN
MSIMTMLPYRMHGHIVLHFLTESVLIQLAHAKSICPDSPIMAPIDSVCP